MAEHAVNGHPITVLRDFVPIRPLTRHEALTIAERQALRLLALAELTTPPVSESLIAELPRVMVKRVSPFPTSGAAQWVRGQWVVILNGAEPATRQRFSLAHEFKHILDHRFVDQLYGAIDARDRHTWIEQVCDYFAGCLLVPRPWLKRAWASEQHLGRLARQFQVSQAAMNTRLAQVGLVPPAPRCAHDAPPSAKTIRAFPSYERASRVRLLQQDESRDMDARLQLAGATQ
ncbi:MAG: ImmA/IrrE family metallo-endopeptidase [Solirubrobacteraceae bacterium]